MGIVIKGVSFPALLIKLDKEKTFDENVSEIEEKLSSAFFKGSMAAVDYNGTDISEAEERELEETLRRCDTKFLGLRTSGDSERRKNKNLGEIREKKSLEIVNKTVRSGQKIEHDGDLLIMGDVNPGSYVVASGNVIVMGTLRGVVHAGASGDETAVVMALSLVPQQLRIGSFITRAPDDVEETPEYPEKAYVRDHQILIEKIQT